MINTVCHNDILILILMLEAFFTHLATLGNIQYLHI